MKPYYQDANTTILHGDCIETMRSMPDDSIDSIVTDPPYGLGFMGKKWDSLPPGEEWARECLRVLKPGGHILAFGGTRTWHRLAVAIEDAGFEIRDGVLWLYGSGFPKSHDISKAIDKMAGAEREVIGVTRKGMVPGRSTLVGNYSPREPADLTAPATPEAVHWEGWGTALKPAFEPIVMARKPFIGTVAGNVLKHGTGAINIDACRIAATDKAKFPAGVVSETESVYGGGAGIYGDRPRPEDASPSGRFPANLILDERMAEVLDEQSGTTKSSDKPRKNSAEAHNRTSSMGKSAGDWETRGHNDSGGASRFFYCAKAGKSERPVVDGVAHATVKPLKLMRYLVRMVTPPNGVVLDPFAGSGTTIEAALIEGYNVIGIERETDYLPLIQHRINRATS